MDNNIAHGIIKTLNSTLDSNKISIFLQPFLFYEKYIANGFSVLGIYGNVVSIYIFWSNRKDQHPCNLFLLALAFADIGVIVWKSLLGGYLGDQVLKWLTLSDGSCQTIKYMWKVSTFISSWLIVAYSVERFIAIAKPDWFRTVTSRHAKIMIGCIICFPFILFIPHFLVYRVTTIEHNNKQCQFDPGASGLGAFSFISGIASILILPCLILVAVNIFIIWRLRRKKIRQQNAFIKSHSAAHSKRVIKNENRNRKITLNLLIISGFHLILLLPFITLWALHCFKFCGLNGHENKLQMITSTVGSDIWALGKLFSSMTSLNNCLNFICYGMNLDFYRKKFLKISTCGLFSSSWTRKPVANKNAITEGSGSVDNILDLPLGQNDLVNDIETINSCVTSNI